MFLQVRPSRPPHEETRLGVSGPAPFGAEPRDGTRRDEEGGVGKEGIFFLFLPGGGRKEEEF